jgi:hypothetical protein
MYYNTHIAEGVSIGMDEETMSRCIEQEGHEYTLCLELNRIANTLERLLKLAEMRP